MTDDRLNRQLAFIDEIDKLKRIERRTRPIGMARRENSAEHSWDVATMATVLAEYSVEPIELPRVVRMLLVHDLVEIDAGDTFLFDTNAHGDKRAREVAAADRIYTLLPPDQAVEFRSLWEEFEARDTPEARFAAAVDRLTGILMNSRNEGGTWREYGVAREQVEHYIDSLIAPAAPALADRARELARCAVEQGWLKSDGGTAPGQS